MIVHLAEGHPAVKWRSGEWNPSGSGPRPAGGLLEVTVAEPEGPEVLPAATAPASGEGREGEDPGLARGSGSQSQAIQPRELGPATLAADQGHKGAGYLPGDRQDEGQRNTTGVSVLKS